MSQLIPRQNSDLAIVDRQIDFLFSVLEPQFQQVFHELLEENPAFFKSFFSIYYPFSPELAVELIDTLEIGTTYYSSFDPANEQIKYAKLGLSFNEAINWELIRNDEKLHTEFSSIWYPNSLDWLPLNIDLERQYKILCNRKISQHFRPRHNVAREYLSYEESLLSIPVYQSIYSIEELEKLELKRFRLFDRSFYLNFEPLLSEELIIQFFMKFREK